MDTRRQSGRRLSVFIDYQNVLRSAADAFGIAVSEANPSPLRLGEYLAEQQGAELELVRVFTGIHSNERRGKLYAMMERRMAAWRRSSPKVGVKHRTLVYDRDEERFAREKGVDVQLAVDLVRHAISIEDDAHRHTIVLASMDTDLLPALEFASHHVPDAKIVTLGFKPISASCRPPAALKLHDHDVTRLSIDYAAFLRFRDPTNYFEP